MNFIFGLIYETSFRIKSLLSTVIIIILIGIIIRNQIVFTNTLNTAMDEQRFLTERVNEELTISDNERRLKIISMYGAIVSRYGNKFHPNNNQGDNRRYQGLSKWQMADYLTACYKYETLLGIPYFTLVSIALIETSFNPIAATYWDNNKPKEAGMYQHRKEAVGQALLYHKSLTQVNPGIADQLSFSFSDMPDLYDPVNAAKVAAVLLWGLKREFRGEQPYYISAYHWGLHKVMPYYQNNHSFPKRFEFNKGLSDEDIRNPILYFLVFNEYYSAFSRFRLQVNIDYTYVERYKKRCSDIEWQFIDSWKFIKQLKEQVSELQDFQVNAKKEHIELLTKLNDRLNNTEKEYNKILGITKTGKFQDIRDVFKLWRVAFNSFIEEMKHDKIHRIKFIQLCIIVFLIAGVVISLGIIIFRIIFRRKVRKIVTRLVSQQKKELG